jgi:hypothetical protein
MPDFYFRGTLAQYWKAIYAEYQRLFSVYGREPNFVDGSCLLASSAWVFAKHPAEA